MVESLTLLGSTGSIGTQTLEVCEKLNIRLDALSAYTNSGLLERQARRYKPQRVCCVDERAAADLKIALADTGIKVLSGSQGLVELASCAEGAVMNALVGVAGLAPTLAAIDSERPVMLANKEALVVGGSLVMAKAAERGVSVIPVDSEHSAIYQCLVGNPEKSVNRLILTASGGPFFGKKAGYLSTVKIADALKHPKWYMGAKVTIDSATMLNKGFELLEAMWLFGVPADRIKIVVHPESIVHSMVEYADGAVIAQLAVPDMRLPIQYSFTAPERFESLCGHLNFDEASELHFYPPDTATFTTIDTARAAAGRGTLACTALNAANEVAVELFLRDRIRFADIFEIAHDAVINAPVTTSNVCLDDIMQADCSVRAATRAAYERNRI